MGVRMSCGLWWRGRERYNLLRRKRFWLGLLISGCVSWLLPRPHRPQRHPGCLRPRRLPAGDLGRAALFRRLLAANHTLALSAAAGHRRLGGTPLSRRAHRPHGEQHRAAARRRACARLSAGRARGDQQVDRLRHDRRRPRLRRPDAGRDPRHRGRVLRQPRRRASASACSRRWPSRAAPSSSAAWRSRPTARAWLLRSSIGCRASLGRRSKACSIPSSPASWRSAAPWCWLKAAVGFAGLLAGRGG